MANKQQRKYKTLNIKVQSNGPSPTISGLEHGPNAFLKPCQAIERLRKAGSRSWKVTKRHPNNPTRDKR